jgi:hypothetical protein
MFQVRLGFQKQDIQARDCRNLLDKARARD